MPETSNPEQKEWKGFLSSMFSSLFWSQESRLMPKNLCPKCNRPKLQTSPFEVRCKCSILPCPDSSPTSTKQCDSQDSVSCKSSITLVHKSSPITSKLSALCNNDSFMKLIIKESTTQFLAPLRNSNQQPSSIEELNIPMCKDAHHMFCHLRKDEKVLNTNSEEDDNDNDNTDDDDDSNDNEDDDTDDSDDKCQVNVDNYSQTELTEDSSDGISNEKTSTTTVHNGGKKEFIGMLSSKSSTCSSCEHSTMQEFAKSSSMKCLSSVEQIKADIISSCDRNFSCKKSQSNSVTYFNNSIQQPSCTPPEESSQNDTASSSSSTDRRIVRRSRIPIYYSRLVNRNYRDESSTATNVVSGSTITKTVNYQQTILNENKSIPKKVNRGSAVPIPTITSNAVYRSFHLPTQAKQKKRSQSFYVTPGNLRCKTSNEKKSKIINILDNRYSDTQHGSLNNSLDQKEIHNSKLIKPVHHNDNNKNKSSNVQTNNDKSRYSKYVDMYPGSHQMNLNDTIIRVQRKPSICSSLLSTDMDDETILIIEKLIPKDYHELRHTDKETVINDNTNNSTRLESFEEISLKSQNISKTFSIKSSKPTTPI